MRPLGHAGLGLLCLLSLLKLTTAPPGPLKRTRVEIDPSKFPVQAMRMLKEQHVKANALIYWDWAEFAIWHLHPDTKVFIDGRLRSAYGLDVINDYLAFETMDTGWDRVLTHYPTDMVFMKHTSNPIGKTEHPIRLIEADAKAYPNDFVQVRYNVHYSLSRTSNHATLIHSTPALHRYASRTHSSDPRIKNVYDEWLFNTEAHPLKIIKKIEPGRQPRKRASTALSRAATVSTL